MGGPEDPPVTADAQGAPDTPWARELLGHLRPAARDVHAVVAWLAGAAHGSAGLLDGTGTLLAGHPVPLDPDLLADIAAGRIASAALEDRGRHIRVVSAGPPQALGGSVLAVARPAPFDRAASEMVTHAAAVVELLLRADRTAETGRRLDRAAAALRLAVLQLLMVEDVVSARRVCAGLWPGLLDTDTACVYVVEARRGARDHLTAECLAATGGGALVVRCPAVDEHVIVVAPAETAGRHLRALVRGRPHTFLGGSARHGLARTATAYGQAVSALAVARFRPDGAAVYAERTHPERLMDPAALHAWSARLLRPLDVLPHHTRAELVATTRLGLEFTAVNTAKILGVSRNTVRARMDRTETLLGADLTRLTHRAAVHLALNTQAGQGFRPVEEGALPAGADGLGTLLTDPAPRAWAHELLDRLRADARDLRGTLRSWIAAGGNAERAAQRLGVHAQTVREHVRCAEPVLERQLLASGSDLYEVVLALLALGELELPDLVTAAAAPPEATPGPARDPG
ncbi:helix-turn-helix domain-containing protein [Streptomyces tropicalis]|uniref:Helix-turn-helix domain-containing protein n=1 Tax=Streptomyces tropicalis TaxID=3034234 RepID=A0ABT6AEW8_9ACTN|nr:helix-turn-helix domain-containing protein [Streptomyces tropicalis]MDF3302886.1 helix-turn-helix domain-containing protein [Streptomyces tropicalis]